MCSLQFRFALLWEQQRSDCPLRAKAMPQRCWARWATDWKSAERNKKTNKKKTLPALSASQQWEMEGAAAWSWVSALGKGSCIYLVNELLGAIKLFEAGAQWADCPPWCSWGAGGPSGGLWGRREEVEVVAPHFAYPKPPCPYLLDGGSQCAFFWVL